MSDLSPPLKTPDEIEGLARERGMSMRLVCARAGIAQSTFTRWKNGATEPTLAVYRRLLAAVQEPEIEIPRGTAD